MKQLTDADRIVDELIEARLLEPASRSEGRSVVLHALAEVPAGSGAGSGAERAPSGPGGLPRLVEVVAYLGGALVLAAGALFLVQEWNDLGFAARVTLLAVVAVVLAVAGLVAARGLGRDARRGQPGLPGHSGEDTRRRLAGSLLTGSALSTAFLVGHVLDEQLTLAYDDFAWPVVLGSIAGVLVAAVGYRIARTAVGVVGMFAGVFTAIVSGISNSDLPGSEGDAAGVSLLLFGLVWLAVAEAGGFTERTIARTLGVAVSLLGAQIPAMDGTHAWLGYALTALLVAGGVAAYLRTLAWPYLALAVLGVTLVVPEAVSDWTEGSLGATGGVLVAGLTLLLASFAGYRLRAEAVD